ncbi:hypothetical protein IEO21_02099 [Rhodonia placenta]|uniref:Peptidase S59 domain-containing protein n=1 Tax=Rhodonia placenta TaxID=104341 RepID=A0A8H7P8K4_9APHY|nr:hypothetical protein IEO21_02099 [Postia placenta]
MFGGFGNTNATNTPAAPTTGGFGAFGQTNTAPATTSAFGNAFGQQPQQQQQQQQPQQTTGFGGLGQPQQNTAGTGLFGGGANNLGASINPMNISALGPNPQGSLTASIAQPIGSNLPIFNLFPPGPRAISLDPPPKKKVSFFADVPTRTPVPRIGLGYVPAQAKLRGYGSTNVAPGQPNAGSSLLFQSSKPNALNLSKSANGKSTLGPDALLSNGNASPTLGSGSRKSVKKLVLDKRVDASDLFNKSSSGGKVVFSSALSVAAREREAAAIAAAAKLPRPAPRKDKAAAASEAATAEAAKPRELQDGDYWVKPDLETLKRTGHEELVAFKGLVIGRKGYGQIEFLDPVDLTNVPKLSDLLGHLVRFDEQECSVYPDCEEADKPQPGAGLNNRARITLMRCWTRDKATRDPIKDPEHPLSKKHYKRLNNMRNTHFESFDFEEGKWVFIVDKF